jgi:hypothetical protein
VKPLPHEPAILAIAERVVWFEPAETALRDPARFMAYAMRYGSHEDMSVLRGVIGDDGLREALAQAPAGIIDPRSWWYWHALTGTAPPPPMPTRRLPA